MVKQNKTKADLPVARAPLEAFEIDIDPHEAESLSDGRGDLTASVQGIVKAMVGPALLYLPHGFASAGYMVALPIMAISTALYLHSSRCLLDSWKYEMSKQALRQYDEQSDDNINDNEEELPFQDEPLTQQQSRAYGHSTALSYPDLAYRAFGKKGESFLKVGIALMQSGVCLTYFIFVPHNLQTSLRLLFRWNFSTTIYLVFMTLLQMPLSWVRDIRRFTFTNILANGLIMYGLVLCLCFAFGESTQPREPGGYASAELVNSTSSPAIEKIKQDKPRPISNIRDHMVHLEPLGNHWILFIGTSVLLFEGSITLLIPLQEAVQEKNDRERFPRVYRKTICCIQLFYVVFGVACWMSFGDDVDTVLTTSLPPGFLATTVQLAYSIAVIFTFPLQNYPALEISCRSISFFLSNNPYVVNKLPPQIKQWITKRNVISSGLVFLLAIVAFTTMDALDKVVSLMGGLVGCPVAFVIPPMIHAKLVPDITKSRLRANYAVSLLGSAAMVLASITTILQWNE